MLLDEIFKTFSGMRNIESNSLNIVLEVGQVLAEAFPSADLLGQPVGPALLVVGQTLHAPPLGLDAVDVEDGLVDQQVVVVDGRHFHLV